MLYLISTSITTDEVPDIKALLDITPLAAIVLAKPDKAVHELAQEFGVPILLSNQALHDASMLARESSVALMDEFKNKLSIIDGEDAVRIL